MVREKKIRYLAFYQPKHFKEEAFKIRWYGEVRDILVMKRKELFPEQKSHPRADEDYYRLELSALNERTQPIFCRRPRRVLFIATTLEKFQKAIEINDVFYVGLSLRVAQPLWSDIMTKCQSQSNSM